jgi:hypothetical protein
MSPLLIPILVFYTGYGDRHLTPFNDTNSACIFATNKVKEDPNMAVVVFIKGACYTWNKPEEEKECYVEVECKEIPPTKREFQLIPKQK